MKQSLERFCVITPSFNGEKYLQACLDSVSACQHVHRHIVMDGGSKDGTVDLLKAHQQRDPRLLWVSQKDKGQADALNKALALVESPFFGWLNADDVYQSSAMDRAFEELRQMPDSEDVSMVYGDYRLIDAAGRETGYRKQPSYRYADCLYAYLTVMNSSALFNTATARRVGGFDANLQFAMDYDLVLRMGREGKVHLVSSCLSSFRRHDDAKTTTMQEVYRKEIEQLRTRYGAVGSFMRPVVSACYRTRVLLRMALEGCLVPRLRERLSGA